jgi:prepilin-type processing-associated H-X9-DG protein
MFISLTCECGRQFETPDAGPEVRARCPDCGREFTVPRRPSRPDEEFVAWGQKPSVTSGKAIASIALGVFFVFACLSGIPAIILGWQALSDIRQSGGQLKGRRLAVAGIVFGLIGCLFTVALILPAMRSAGEAARRAQCTNNFKQIGLAIHNYAEAYGCLPPAAITDRQGKPLLSWRVAVLTFLEASPLYASFHLDEPWDSPHNLSLLEPVPLVYICPSDRSRKPGTTGYQTVLGPDTAFTPDFKPLLLSDLTDGVSRTLLVGETRRSVPWTKPEDLSADMPIPLRGLGSDHGHHSNGFNVLFADGSVRFLKSSIEPRILDSLITRNGSELIGPDSY